MALLFRGSTPCGVCGKPIYKDEEVVAYPAFLPKAHRLWKYSDGVFHSKCVSADPNLSEVESLYQQYRSIWETRPAHLTTDGERDAWGKSAFADFAKEPSDT